MSTSRSTFGQFGLITIATIFIVSVSLSNLVFRGMRLDLTESGLYTLSEGTIKVLGAIPEPINIYFFFSDRGTANNPYIRTYAGRVKEMLQEFVQHSDGKLRLTIVDPLPFSDDEDRAAEFGLQGINIGTSAEAIYMGIAATNSIGDEEIISFMDPGKESFLEYDLGKLIDTLANPERPVIGLISGLPITAAFDPRTQRMGEPWLITAQIRQSFELRSLPNVLADIDEDIAVLLVVHPKDLPDDTLYAIDQFILDGGRALLFVDPYSEVDVPAPDPGNPAAAMMASHTSTLNRLLDAWGVAVSDEVIGDDRFALTVSGVGGQPVRHIGLFSVDETGMNDTDVVTSGLRSINFTYPGYITAADGAAAEVAMLLQSSDIAGPMPTAMLSFLRDPNQLRDDFAPTGSRYMLAARIEGIVPSAFPNGRPGAGASANEQHLTEAQSPINVILVADTDLLTDRLWAQVQNFFGQRISTAFANNSDFVMNALDNLTGSGDLISVRGRATFTRPFTRVQELRREAENRFRLTEQRLQQELADTESKLSELQASREDSSAFIMTPEQEAALEEFQEERLRIRKELRQVQRDLDQQIEDLGTWLKIINIGLVPIIISLLSIIVVVMRRRFTNRLVAES